MLRVVLPTASNFHAQRRAFAAFTGVLPEVAIKPTPSPLPRSSYTPLQNALSAQEPRNNWTKAEIESIYNTGTLELAFASVRISLSHIRSLKRLVIKGVVVNADSILACTREQFIVDSMIRLQSRCALS